MQHDTFTPFVFDGYKRSNDDDFDTTSFIVNPNQKRWSPRTALNTGSATHISVWSELKFQLILREKYLLPSLTVLNGTKMVSISWMGWRRYAALEILVLKKGSAFTLIWLTKG